MNIKTFFALLATLLIFKTNESFAQANIINPIPISYPGYLVHSLQTPMLQTGKILDRGTYKVSAFVPFLKTDTRANITFQGELGVSTATSANAIISLGSLTSITGGYKWIPYPDLKGGQPAIGGIIYINYYFGDDVFSLDVIRVLLGPVVSKIFHISDMALNLYSSILANIQRAKTLHRFSMHLGTEVTFASLKNLSFQAEWGFGFGNFQDDFQIANRVRISNTVLIGASVIF